MPSATPLLARVQAQVARVQAGLEALSTMRLDVDGGALGVVAARHFQGEELGTFSRGVDRLMQERGVLAETLRVGKGQRHMETRLAYHELLSVDALLREHVLEVCGCPSADFALQQRTRVFELGQMQASNADRADRMPAEVFVRSLAHMTAVPPPGRGAGLAAYATVMTRGLLASALLRSLQQTRFQIATDNCFVYCQGVAHNKTDETCAGEVQFLMDKIKKDARHEIIPHVLGTHILSLLLQGGRSPAHLAQAERVIAIFSPDLRPLLRAGLLGEPAPDVYGFLLDPATRTGYVPGATSELMLDLLCA